MDQDFILTLVDDSRSARSMQKQIGPSEIGGCKRRTWHRVQGHPVINETLSMAAWMGTAIHSAIEKKIRRSDPFSEKYLLEEPATVGDLTGHVDCYDIENREVIDWKTTTKRRLADFPSEQQRWQVQVYGYLMRGNGYPVDTVTLVGIPRDGNETHVKIHSEPYDESVAIEALEWLASVRSSVDPPEPTEHVRFCRDYCSFYNPRADDDGDGCPGGGR